MPLSPILGNFLKVRILRKRKCRSLLSPSRHTGEAICTVADHRQVIRDRLRFHTKFSDDAGFIPHNVLPAIQLYDSGAYHTLTKIFVRCANEYSTDTLILRGSCSGGSERIIGLVIHHWPYDHSHCFQRFLENRKLREQFRSHAFSRLVSGIQVVAKRLHDMVGCNPDVSCATLNHGYNGRQDTTHCTDFLTVRIFRGGHGEKMPEQFVGSVNQVHIHATASRMLTGTRFPSLTYDPLSIAMNRLFSDSASVGWAKVPSRSAVYGNFPIMAISRADMISPPSIPRMATPRIWLLSASTTAFMKPRVSSTSRARATCVMGSFSTRMLRPCLRASDSVKPTRPNCGSMKRVYGTCLFLVEAVFFSMRLERMIRKSSYEMCVNAGPPLM